MHEEAGLRRCAGGLAQQCAEEGGDIWKISIQDEVVNVLLLNVQVPTSYQSLDANTYAWVVKKNKIT